MINKMQAVNLRHGDILHFGRCIITIGPHGGERSNTESWRVSGKCQTWKTRPDRFRVPVKYGLYKSYEVNDSNAHEWHLQTLCSPLHQCSQDGCTWQTPCHACEALNHRSRAEE